RPAMACVAPSAPTSWLFNQFGSDPSRLAGGRGGLRVPPVYVAKSGGYVVVVPMGRSDTTHHYSVRLSAERPKAFVRYCDANGLTPSQGLKNAIDALLGSGKPEAGRQVAAQMRDLFAEFLSASLLQWEQLGARCEWDHERMRNLVAKGVTR